jgi:drug/metabolite transporter (DMT)-like permease
LVGKRVSREREQELLGIQYMLLASFLFAIMGVLVKELSDSMSSLEIVFFRNIFGVAIISYSIWRYPLVQQGGRFWLLIFRGTMGFIALLAFFYNITQIPLADAMTFSKTAPIFTAIFAYFLLGERLNFFQVGAVFLGFVGIIFIIQPEEGLTFSKTDILGVFSGVGAALAYTAVRELRKNYESRAIVLSFTTVGTVGPLLLLLIGTFLEEIPESIDFLVSPFVIPNLEDMVYIVAMGVIATFSQIFMTKAYGETKAGVVGAVSYSNILFSLILGLIFLDEVVPNSYTFFGISLVVISGVLVQAPIGKRK